MIRITDKSDCCGCTACVSVCPVHCIVMRRDREEGFDYPVANPDICIGCGRCESVCPVLNPRNESLPTASYAARSSVNLQESSSGGVFPLVAAEVIARNGIVYGAVLNADFQVVHEEADSIQDVWKMRGSKYVQSDLFASFEDVKTDLDAGRHVLFTGTPCQVAGLRNSLGKDYERLITIDCACHGVPGPGLWEKYVKELERRAGGKLVDITFRDKSDGWYHYSFKVNGKRIPYMDDPYMALFVQSMTLRPSCYRCPVRGGRSGSDLTLADLWNAASVAADMDDDRGVSLVCLNTDKGHKIFETIKERMTVRSVDYHQAVKNNGGFAYKTEIPEERTEFFRGLESADDLYRYMSRFVKRSYSVSSLIKGVRRKLYMIKKKVLS